VRGHQTLRRALHFKMKVFRVHKVWSEMKKERGCDGLRLVILSEPDMTDRPHQDFLVCKTKLSKDRSTNYDVHFKGCRQQAETFFGNII